MTQPTIPWDRDVSLPVSGLTPAARHASASGAQAAGKGQSGRTRAYLRMLAEHGPCNDMEASALLGCYRTSINSIRHALMYAGLVEETGQFDVETFASGRVTRRQRYALTARGQEVAR